MEAPSFKCQVSGLRLAVPAFATPAATLVASLVLGACGGPSGLISIGALPAADTVLADRPPTDVYAAIAQKALVCWMGPKGPLKITHVFHADAASPTTGGKAEIALHERDLTQKHPWGARTFRVELTDEGGGTNTRIAIQNIKLPRDLAEALRVDIYDWSRGKDGCQAQVVRPPPPDPVAAPVKGKTKKAKSA
jgi:hypothetical protein